MTRVPASIRNHNPKTLSLTVEQARQWLAYDPETGVVWWRSRKGTKIRRDMVAGYVDHEGYRVIRINCVNHRAHRLAWLLHYGEWPTEMIDHANGIKSDNRLINLRVATNAQNQMNKVARRSSASGFKGVVVVNKSYGPRYRPQIVMNGKLHTFGLFKTAEAAHAVYCREAALRFREFARFE